MKSAVARFYWSHLPNAQRVLDLGCDVGDLGRCRPEGVSVYGLDLNADRLERAKQFETVQAWDLDSPAALPFPDDYFDAVVAKDILEHIQRPWQMLSQVKRVVRPGGYILASVICERGRRTWDDYTHVRGFTRHSLRQMFTDAGLEVMAIWRMGGVPLTSRMDSIRLVPYLLRFPIFDWIWTSSYEIKARRPE